VCQYVISFAESRFYTATDRYKFNYIVLYVLISIWMKCILQHYLRLLINECDLLNHLRGCSVTTTKRCKVHVLSVVKLAAARRLTCTLTLTLHWPREAEQHQKPNTQQSSVVDHHAFQYVTLFLCLNTKQYHHSKNFDIIMIQLTLIKKLLLD